MSADRRFGLLRNMLRALGLSQESADDIVNWIADLLAGEDKNDVVGASAVEFPYQRQDNFLTPAELSFYEVLREVVGNRAVLCAKVGLRDIFKVKTDDPSRNRIYTNKIDRKHVDFLLCDKVTMRPLAGIELDDKSHQRVDRQVRDSFVDRVFAAAHLPLVHIPVRRTYDSAELTNSLGLYFGGASPTSQTQVTVTGVSQLPIASTTKPSVLANPVNTAPRCPKCGSVMILRTAKSGSNAGNQFWGCSNYPNCRSMVSYQG